MPSFSLNLDNDICKYIEGKCNLNKNDFFINSIGNDKKIFDKIDSIQISKLFSDNKIDINPNSFNPSESINLYTQTYIGLPDTKISIQNVFTVYLFSKIKNILLIIFTLIFVCFCFSIFNFFNKNFGIYGFVVFVLVNIFMFINWVLSIVSVVKYNQITNDVFENLNNSITNEFKNKKWNFKINIALIIFYFFDLCLSILNVKILLDENILSFKTETVKKQKDKDKKGVSPYGIRNVGDINDDNSNDSTNEESQLRKKLEDLDNWFEELGFENDHTIKKAQELIEKEKKNAKKIEDELKSLKEKNKKYLEKKLKEEAIIEDFENKIKESNKKKEKEEKELNEKIEKLNQTINGLKKQFNELENTFSEENSNYEQEKTKKNEFHAKYMETIKQYQNRKKKE